MKILVLCLLFSFSALAKDKEPPEKPPDPAVQQEGRLENLKRCKFSDWDCKRRNERPSTRKLRRLSRF